MMKDKKHGHMKHKGIMMLVLGALILANVYWMGLTWAVFIGGVFMLAGLIKVIHSFSCKGG